MKTMNARINSLVCNFYSSLFLLFIYGVFTEVELLSGDGKYPEELGVEDTGVFPAAGDGGRAVLVANLKSVDGVVGVLGVAGRGIEAAIELNL